jgi:hypothetical protein
MNDLRIPFVLWFRGEAAPDLSSMATPIQLSIGVVVDQLSRRAASSDQPTAKDDANV